MSSRVPHVAAHDLDTLQSEFYRKYAEGPRAAPGVDFRLVDDEGQLLGPPAIWIISGGIGLALEGLGRELRFGLSLNPRLRELAIMLVAGTERSPFELYAHRAAARRAGVSEAEIAAIESDGRFAPRDDEERFVLEVTRALLDDGDVADELWFDALATLGQTRLFELVTLVGYYRLVALQLRAYRITPPDAPASRTEHDTP